jgi:hypothetical protein
MTKKTKKKRSDPLFDFFRHPLSPLGHLNVMRRVALATALCGMFWLACAALAFEPAGGAQSSSRSHAHDFVIFATVFNPQGFALFGARAKVRREEEKKFRWEAASDHQGEFAIRVPQNAQYEITIEAHGFKTQTRKVDASEDTRADLTFRMEPQAER